MRTILLFSLVLNFLFLQVAAQDTISSSQNPITATPTISLTPEMSASSVSSFYSTLATSVPQQPGDGPSAGDAGSSASSTGSDAGAAGPDSGSITLSHSGLIAIIVVIVIVCVFGIASSVLWYLAKKRSWEVRKTIRRSARKVATALTPRRTTFPKDVRRKSSRGLTRIDEMPNTPRGQSIVDVEKANHPKMSSFELSEPPKAKGSKWGKKLGR